MSETLIQRHVFSEALMEYGGERKLRIWKYNEIFSLILQSDLQKRDEVVFNFDITVKRCDEASKGCDFIGL